MNLEDRKNIHGFRLLDEQMVTEVNSKTKLFEHEKSGARLLFLENDDDNKVFSVTFRTPPTDSTGVAHIVEHSVLCGSRKFPLKEPFVELVKGSLNTFLNAMTFPDKTMYPVASRNEKDFRNLMDVYLDAVFFPNMLKDPEILMQEGWHYELDDKDSELTYKGVVYNEMKGVFSSPDAILDHKILEILFPDNTYGFESGGDPDVIPELTYEQFCEFHSKYYHPSNSYIFLYGNMDIADTLKFLDGEYLSKFAKQPIQSAITPQQAFTKPVDKVFPYAVSTSEPTEDKSMLSLNFVVSSANNAQSYLAFQMLAHLLLDTPAAPLKKALIDAGIGKEVFGYFTESLLQPTFSIIVSGANQANKEEFIAIVNQTFQTLVTEGIPAKLAEASVNSFEFKLREANYGGRPKGLAYNIKCMDSWLYEADPLLHLAYEPTLAKIKAGLQEGYFESLLKKYFLENPHQAVVTLVPQPGLAEEKSEEVKAALAKHKSSLSEQQLQAIIEQTKKLKQRQETPDSEEALAVIPLVKLSDLESKAEVLPLVERAVENIPLLFHPIFTNQIAYVNLLFDTRQVPQADIPYIHLLAEMLGKINTNEHEYGELANEINLHTGGIYYDILAYADKASDEHFYPKFRIRSKALVTKLPQALQLLGEVAGNSSFSDKKRLREVIQQTKANWETSLFRRGQQIAASRVLSYLSPVAKYNESGLLSFYQFLIGLEKNVADRLDEISAKLEQVARLIFNKENLLISLTCEEEGFGQFENQLQLLTSQLGNLPFKPSSYQFELAKLNEGLMTSGKVQYVTKGANFRREGFTYHGSLKVLETILRYDYLWNRIRVQGGAYGGFAQFERTGNMVFGSYRDPNLKESLQVYDETARFLRTFNVSEREMTKYIIGTMSQLDSPLTPQMKGERATMHYIRNITQSDIQQERDEIISTKRETVRNLADMIESAMKQNYICVMGSEQKIKANKELFGKLVAMFE
ncbi:insulinase family protein [Anaerospora sp.]|uniref:insulinase family protein n=1 Tax=Anaerospora sp. TaxID=1960278 RepID=UPI0028A01A1E|nr:insulinase family protein [Anaerospora sp.]